MADSEAKWYILHTYSGYEKKVADDIRTLVDNRNLGHLIEDVTIPTTKRTVEKEVKENGAIVKKTVEVEEKVYPGYVFVKMVETNESWYICRNTRGVTGFVGPESKPTPLSESEAMALERGRFDKEENAAPAFKVGDEVVITGGIFVDFTGTVTEVDEESKTLVVNLVNMMGGIIPATIEFSAVKKV